MDYYQREKQEEDDGGNPLQNTIKHTKAEEMKTFTKTMVGKDTTRFLENHSTMSDLAYNHFPKYYQGEPVDHNLKDNAERHEPEDMYLKNFGNITRSGLVEQKREQWQDEQEDQDACGTVTGTTASHDTYSWPDVKLEPPIFGKCCKPMSG